MTGIDVEEADLSGDGGGERGEGDEEGRGILRSLLGFAVGVVRLATERALGQSVARVRRRVRVLGILALAFLVIGTVASIVWTLVGVAFLAERFPSTVDPLVFASGFVAGYVVAVVAGIVYR